MSKISPDNEAQQRYWSEPGGRAWTRLQQGMDIQLGPFGVAAIDALAPARGERVLDVGCGCGETTLQVAARVGAEGFATGVDISAPMLARARARAAQSKVVNAQFLEADAQVAPATDVGAPFDAVVSRFGVMFFSDPVAAFANIRSWVAPEGRLAFVCWQAPEANPWMSNLAREVAAGLPWQPPLDPGAPGPLAFADPARTEDILRSSGWNDVSVTPCVRTMQLFGTDDFESAVDASLEIGATARLLADATADQRSQARSVAERVLRSVWSDGGALMDGSAWLVTAKRPA
jgi:SAM-dependent methyltransferase